MENQFKKNVIETPPASDANKDFNFQKKLSVLRDLGIKRRLLSSFSITLVVALTALAIFVIYFLWSEF